MKKDKMITELKNILGEFSNTELYDLILEKSKIEFLKINERELEIFRLRLVEQLKYKDIAERFNVSVSAVRLIMEKVLRKLSRRIKMVNTENAISILISYKIDIRTLNSIIRGGLINENMSVEELIKGCNRALDYSHYLRGFGDKSKQKLKEIVYQISKDYNIDPESRFCKPIDYSSSIEELSNKIEISNELKDFLINNTYQIKENNIDKILEIYYLVYSMNITMRYDINLELCNLVHLLWTGYSIEHESRLLELGILRKCCIDVKLCNKPDCLHCNTFMNFVSIK